METQELILESIRNDVAQVGQDLKQIALRVISEGISEYPVFVAAQEMVDIGKPIFDRGNTPINWFFNASILEDFTRKKIVLNQQVNHFKKTYGDPKEKACIFVISEGKGQFVFVPYEIE